jgi:hypothetical protein
MKTMRLKLLPAAALLLSIQGAAAEHIGGDRSFSFVALGDQPYNLPDDGIKFDRLIGAVNKLKPAFTLHVGDIKSARIPCSDEVFKQALAQLQTFEGALVYTIGDNEWTDCHRKQAGGFDPRERLTRLRQLFFADPGLLRQSSDQGHEPGASDAGIFNLRRERSFCKERRPLRERARSRLQ